MDNLIDLTQDSDGDEDVYQDSKKQTLLARFLGSQPAQPTSLKRKYLHDEPRSKGLPEAAYQPPANHNVFFNPLNLSSNKRGFTPQPRPEEEKTEKREYSLKPLSNFDSVVSISSRGSSIEPSVKKQYEDAVHSPITSDESIKHDKAASSEEKSIIPTLPKKETSLDDDKPLQTSSSSRKGVSARVFPTVSVVVPQLPTLSPMGMKHRKIKRLPSLSDDSSGEDSDPDELKGIKTKYYPIDLHEIQAGKGRYPTVRCTKPQSLSAESNPIKGHIRSKQAKFFYLRESLNKKLRSIKGPSVTMADEWSGAGSLASNFEFTNTYKLLKGVKRVSDEFNAGCDCGRKCDPARCLCLTKEEDTEALMVPYEMKNGQVVLKDSFINKKTMIYECSSHCGCGKDCWNRLVQHGRTIRLEIFHTGSRGFGLRSPDPIVRGQFIDCYLGEVITSAEADLREDAAGSQNSPSYLFSLDFFPSEGDEDDAYVVDGQRLGGPSRFMNHSCNPNCKMFPVSTHHGDQRIYDLAFFALRDIPAGTELTFDYNPDWNGDRNRDPNAVKCLCGEYLCRGQLWPNQRKSTKEE
ncbi:hypothetical protein BGW36DRAFT_378514 [Talaromyces proteolyticus]|uniref:SET domain-containing protein n=1 Tax=Talaromyces proteolyticus TaxID=1131652 RepID=A0AAD4KP89_9EURO|nr:uncharacterized protein BGW36DRAFT_378514 [Talaromyces proteolyticus]KAH8697357.1 hypothetical protein BGW36DRAFT_378514 [Talaromyces proteolyticus]